MWYYILCNADAVNIIFIPCCCARQSIFNDASLRIPINVKGITELQCINQTHARCKSFSRFGRTYILACWWLQHLLLHCWISQNVSNKANANSQNEIKQFIVSHLDLLVIVLYKRKRSICSQKTSLIVIKASLHVLVLLILLLFTTCLFSLREPYMRTSYTLEMHDECQTSWTTRQWHQRDTNPIS